MNKKFIAIAFEHIEIILIHRHVRELLPAVRDDIIFPVTLSARKVKNDMLLSHRRNKPVQLFKGYLAAAENI